MIEAGTILIEASAARPECFHLAGTAEANRWVALAGDLSARDREKALTAEGWSFAYMAGALHVTAAGFNAESRMASALKQLARLAGEQHCNCLEIDEVAMHRCLGVPYLSVSAHSRDIWKTSPLNAR